MVERTFKVGAQPMALALSPDGRRLAVSCARSNDVWVLDLAGGPSRRIDTGAGPAGLFFDAALDRLLVAEGQGQGVSQVMIDEKRVTRRFKVLASPQRLQRFDCLGDAAENERYLVTGLDYPGAGIYRGTNFRQEKTIMLEGPVAGLSPSVDGKDLFAITRDPSSMVRIRVADLSPQVSLKVSGTPVDFVFSKDGRFAWVAGRGHTFDQSSEERAPEPGVLSLVRLKDFRVVDFAPLSAGVRALAISRSGKYLYALCDEEGEVQVLDAFSSKIRARLPLHGSPVAMILSDDGRRLYVAHRDLKQVSEIRLGAWR